MPEFLHSAGRELPFVLLLLALLGLRWRVTPRASVFIKAPLEKVFPLIDFKAGEAQRWQKTRVKCDLVDEAPETYRLTFVTAMATGVVQSSQALFRVAERAHPRLLDIRRAGLEGQSENSQLLRMLNELKPEGGGTRLRITYEWGPRPLLAQLLARADLWGSVYRIKGMAETGKPDFRTDALISAGVAVATGLVTLWTFAFAFGWVVAFMLVAALLVHEFGHLLAYRLIGQPWGRMVFLPFLGAIAVPRMGFRWRCFPSSISSSRVRAATSRSASAWWRWRSICSTSCRSSPWTAASSCARWRPGCSAARRGWRC